MIYNKGILRTIIGIGIIVLMMSGCSTRLQTRVVSKEFPQKSNIVQLQEPIHASENPLKELQIASLESDGDSSFDVPVEQPPQPFIPKSRPQSIFAAPQEIPIVKEESIGSVPDDISGEANRFQATVDAEASLKDSIDDIPFIEFEPELPPLPTLKRQEEPKSHQHPIEIAKVVPMEPVLPRVEEKKELLNTLTDVFFDYDRFGLRKEAFPELEANAELLASQMAGRMIVLQGHCDQRGTESYNMVLGKRRAGAVKEFLVDLGVPGENLSVLSFGKEKPFCTKQTLGCWQENRRVHFVVQ